MYSEMSVQNSTTVQNSATWYRVPEDTFNWYRHVSMPEDSVLQTLVIRSTEFVLFVLFVL
jgi:hypothetical protein